MRSFSPGALVIRHHCPMEVGTYAITQSSKPNQRTNGAVHLLTESVSRTSRILVESRTPDKKPGSITVIW